MHVRVVDPVRRAEWLYGAVLLCAAAAVHGHLDAAWHPLWSIAVIVGGVVLLWHGIHRNAAPAGSGWQRFAYGLTWYAAGDVAYILLVEGLGPDHGLSSVAWFAGLLAAPVAISGLNRVLAVGNPVTDAEGRVDAAITATGIGFIGWHMLVPPLVASGGWLSYGVLGSTVFWLVSVMAMAFVAMRALHDGGWSPSLALIGAAIPLTALTSLVYFVHESDVAWVSAPTARPLMAISYAAIVAAAAHPSMRQQARLRDGDRPVRSRLCVVAGGIGLMPGWHVLAVLGIIPSHELDMAGTLLLALLAVLCVVRLAVTLRAREQDAAALIRQAGEDNLTGLPNRSRLMVRLRAAVERAEGGRGVALIALDLDRFKVVNDSLGHAAGDDLLLAVALRLRAAVHDRHLVARLGGDEFVVVCEDEADEARVMALAEHVREQLALPLDVVGYRFGTTASVGVALLGPKTLTAEDLLRDADVALYRAKDEGRDGVALFDASFRRQVTARMNTERELRDALAEDGLALAYQPIRSVTDGQIIGMEALLRWAEPERHAATPVQIVEAAEETGQIEELGRWVLQRAAEDLASWVAVDPGSELLVGVNVSGLQLRRPGFAESVLTILDDAGISPRHLVVELTESVLIDDWSGPSRILRLLRAAGVRVTMDDFGTGYTALASLRRFPFQSVKIDHGFIAGLDEADELGLALVRAMIGMAHGLGMRVVGEGVERPEQIAMLRRLGCDLMQGYHLGRPMPWSSLVQLLPRSTDGQGSDGQGTDGQGTDGQGTGGHTPAPAGAVLQQ